MNKVIKFFGWIFGNKLRIAILVVIVLAIGFIGYKNLSGKNTQPQYQTAQVQSGSLIQNVTASGQITTANNVQITIQASGVVKDVLVKNGDQVFAGQTIADLTLDQASQQKQASAYASYLSAKSNLDVANAKLNSLQSAEFKANQKFINDAVAGDQTTDNPIYIEEHADWLQAEADYKNQLGVISASQASLNAAGLTLSQVSSTITAPAEGLVKGLTITPGAIVTVTSSSSNSTSASQVLGSIYQEGPIQAQVNLSEIDSIKVAEDQKATMSLDAFPDSTFTGKIVSINTNGVVSSGVTTYPAVISFDTGNDHIYPNMAVTAKIITKVTDNVILVPSAAVSTDANGNSTVKVMRGNNPVSVPVTIGDSNDTQTAVTQGLNDGDTVVTGTITTTRSATGATSPFSAIGGRGVFGGGAGGGAARGGAARGN